MPTTAELLAQAMQWHEAGNLSHAEQFYRQILDIESQNSDAHHLLGVIAYQRGRFEDAVTTIRHAISLNPGAVLYHYNLAVTLEAMGKLEEAAASYRQAIALEPNSGGIHNVLSNTLRKLGKTAEAVAHGRQAVALWPDLPEGHNNLGNALLDEGKREEAAAQYQQALALRPEYPEAHNNLANILRNLGKRDLAVAHYREALRLKRDFPEAHNNFGLVLADLEKWDEAESHYHEALRLLPSYAEARVNLGALLLSKGMLAEAEAQLREALRLRPDMAEAHNNLSNALHRQGFLEEASACLAEALRLKPDYEEAHWNRSLIWLVQGDFERGWPEYEWRWRRQSVVRRTLPRPLWDGSSLEGKTILLWAEQGLGDTFQFIRYAPLVKERGGQVLFECQAELAPLLTGVNGVDCLMARGKTLPAFDCHSPLLSLPGILHTTLTNVPAAVPYLQADATRVELWRRDLQHIAQAGSLRYKVGIAWQGNPKHPGDRPRSIPVSQFARLAKIKGIQLVSLQKGPGAEQLRGLPESIRVLDLSGKLDETGGAFMDTAAVIKNLDLVISSDTAIAHLAGALGVPAWVALPFVADWRWLLRREDCPWYPTMRLFRQPEYGRWEEVFDRMAEELTTLLARHAG